MKILLAGATGRLGREIVPLLLERGYSVRALVRSPERAADLNGVELYHGDLLSMPSLWKISNGIDCVISCAGASMNLRGNEHDSFDLVDYRGNRNLLEATFDVDRFVYVSAHSAEALMHTEYARSHALFADVLDASPVPSTVIRPTGFFYFMNEVLEMARKGRGVVIGSGECRTNPVHEADVARCCVDALERKDAMVEIGGPDILTRRQIVELAFDVLGKEPKISHIPPWLMRTGGTLFSPINPRVAALLKFGVEVSLIDVIAPKIGTRTLRDYFEERG